MSAEHGARKAEWRTVALGDVAEFVRGINFKPDDVVPADTPGSVACMRTKNVQDELDLTDVWSVGAEFVKREEQFLQAGDVLVSSANSWNLVGKCCWIPELPRRSSFGGFVSVLRPNRGKIEPRFLFRWFSSDKIQTIVRSFGQQTTNISNLNTERCLKLEITLPPLEEQRRIAEVLDQTEALRSQRRAALAQLDTLTQSLFLDLFGDPATNPKSWPVRTIAELCEVKGGKRLPKGEEYSLTPTPFRYIRVTDLKDGTVDEKVLVYLKPEVQAKIARYIVNTGDVIISIAGSIGLIAPVPASLNGANLTENAAKLVPRDRKAYDAGYLASLLRTPEVQNQIGSHIGQVTIGKLALFRIKKLTVPLPPIALQQEFARRVTAVDALKTAQRASLAELDALFATIQHRAFRGEL